MNWICPDCGRAFKHKNQAHSCFKIKPEDFFINKSPMIFDLYQKLKRKVEKFGDIKIHASRSMINFTGGGTFMVVRPKNKWLEIEFLSDVEIDKPPVYKLFRFSKNKVAHYVRIESEDDITKNLQELLKRAYKLSC